MKKIKKAKIGLALGSGGARGLAHIGVIKILEKNNIPIDFIAGSSIGAIIGGFYAAGLKIGEIEKIALDTNWRKLAPVFFEPYFRQGLVAGRKLKSFIEFYIGKKSFKDCKIPFSAIATDLKTGGAIVLNKGEMALAIRASASIPLVFKPVEIEGKILVDGGLSAPVPAKITREMGADIVIAVNLDHYYYDLKKKPNLYDIANNSLSIIRHHLALFNAQEADIIINIHLSHAYWYQFSRNKEKILIGQEAAKKIIPEIKALLN